MDHQDRRERPSATAPIEVVNAVVVSVVTMSDSGSWTTTVG